MAADDAGTGASGADGLELSLGLGCPAAPARRSLTMVYGSRVLCAVDVAELQVSPVPRTRRHACVINSLINLVRSVRDCCRRAQSYPWRTGK